MMFFRQVAQSLTTILGSAESGRYQTVGFQRQSKSAEEMDGVKRFVQVYYQSSSYPKEGGRLNGPTQNDMTIQVLLTVSEQATADLSVLEGPESSPAAVASALSASQEASYNANESMDELAEIVYQILMDADNLELGLSIGEVSNRWVESFNKDEPLSKGQYVVITGSYTLTCRVAEEITGDNSAAEETKIFDTTTKITNDIDNQTEDTTEKTGVQVN